MSQRQSPLAIPPDDCADSSPSTGTGLQSQSHNLPVSDAQVSDAQVSDAQVSDARFTDATGSESRPESRPESTSASSSSASYLLIRRADQNGAILLTLISLVMMAGWFLYHHHVTNGLIEIDRAGPVAPAQFQVDINRAAWPELGNLPGIGDGLAQAIVRERDHGGPFVTHEQLTTIDGIGPHRLEQLRPFLAPLGKPAEADTSTE